MLGEVPVYAVSKRPAGTGWIAPDPTRRVSHERSHLGDGSVRGCPCADEYLSSGAPGRRLVPWEYAGAETCAHDRPWPPPPLSLVLPASLRACSSLISSPAIHTPTVHRVR